MERRAGFTLIELLVTISIIAILLTLTVINLRGNQASARDEKRKTDIAVIAQHLETYYASGSTGTAPGGGSYTSGEYPPTAFTNTETLLRAALRDIDPKNLRAPDVADTSTMSFANAPSTAAPAPTVGQYIYQPLTSSGALCQLASDECRKFTLFYKLESAVPTQTLASKNQ
jgi:prepilin-type N-terminal cleavage/methylation domain-containing protein